MCEQQETARDSKDGLKSEHQNFNVKVNQNVNIRKTDRRTTSIHRSELRYNSANKIKLHKMIHFFFKLQVHVCRMYYMYKKTVFILLKEYKQYMRIIIWPENWSKVNIKVYS